MYQSLRDMKAAIYHFTDKSEKRPEVCARQIELLKQFSVSIGYEDPDVFCDKSLRKTDQVEFTRFIEHATEFDALFVKDFYHLSKNTGKAMSILKHLSSLGIKIYSIENGSFEFNDDDDIFNQSLRVATYTCRWGNDNERYETISLDNDIFKNFIVKKTNWCLVGQYQDETLRQCDGEQVGMKKLINERGEFDLLLVNNINDVHWRTSKMCKVRNELQKDIYSLQDGLLRFRRY